MEIPKRGDENRVTRTLACREILSVYSVDVSRRLQMVSRMLIDSFDIVALLFRLAQSSETSQYPLHSV